MARSLFTRGYLQYAVPLMIAGCALLTPTIAIAEACSSEECDLWGETEHYVGTCGPAKPGEDSSHCWCGYGSTREMQRSCDSIY